MVKKLINGLLVLSLLSLPVACDKDTTPVTPSPPVTTTDLPTTKVTPREGDLVTTSSASMPNLSLKDVMGESDMAFIGTVAEIFPSQEGEPDRRGRKSIYTDVAIVPE